MTPANSRATSGPRTLLRCGQDAELRQRIDGMLAADAAAGEFFKTRDAPSPAEGLSAMVSSSSIEKAGGRIGRYKLLKQIGEGGMGLVYMVELDQQVRRPHVASQFVLDFFGLVPHLPS
jgi:hypothetical protein